MKQSDKFLLFDFYEDKNYSLEVELDFQDYDFLFFDEPFCYYSLKGITSKINSFQQLTYYAEVFLFLNPDIEPDMFSGIFRILADREWGKTIRTYGKARVNQMCEEVYSEKKKPYCNNWRKIIFNPNKIISSEEKMAISGLLFSKHISISNKDVQNCVHQLILANESISDQKIAEILECSQKTVSRAMDTQTRANIKESNAFIKRKDKLNKIIEYIDILSEGGNDVKIRELKKFIAVKDYSLYKEAFSIYKDLL